MSNDKTIVLTVISAKIKGDTLEILNVKNENLLPPPVVPHMVSCFISSYLHDAVQQKMIKPESVEKLRKLFLRDIAKLADLTDKCQVGAPEPTTEESKEIRLQFQ